MARQHRILLPSLLAALLLGSPLAAAPAWGATAWPTGPYENPAGDEVGESPYGGAPGIVDSGRSRPRVEGYAPPSVLPGESLPLKISSLSKNYSVEIWHLTPSAGLPALKIRLRRADGRDQILAKTWDASTGTARANWNISLRVNTERWAPGLYGIIFRDGRGALSSKSIFVVRTPQIDPDRPLYAVSMLTYQVYNAWGGASGYLSHTGTRATVVSFDRPYWHPSYWEKELALIQWLARSTKGLQYSTDYDLELAPPGNAPKALLLGHHTEYVGDGLRNWIEEHVERAGDMSLANFGANSFYWRVRLEESPVTGALDEIAIWRTVSSDPEAATDQTRATTLWRSAAVSRPESRLLGASFGAMTWYDRRAGDLVFTDSVPRELFLGTGWSPGTVLRGLAYREGDVVDPSSGAIVIAAGTATNMVTGAPFTYTTVLRTSPAGSRVFNASSLGWAWAFRSDVKTAFNKRSFLRLNKNILTWLGIETR